MNTTVSVIELEFSMGFRLEDDNNWYAEIPDWPGSHWQL